MWISSCQRYGFSKSALNGSTSDTLPPCSRNPPGWFIHALTEITIRDPVNPAITIGIPLNRWTRGASLSHPYT